MGKSNDHFWNDYKFREFDSFSRMALIIASSNLCSQNSWIKSVHTKHFNLIRMPFITSTLRNVTSILCACARFMCFAWHFWIPNGLCKAHTPKNMTHQNINKIANIFSPRWSPTACSVADTWIEHCEPVYLCSGLEQIENGDTMNIKCWHIIHNVHFRLSLSDLHEQCRHILPSP